MKRVDVIVPCYKYAHYLADCVGSVLTQSAVSTRVLIIDDASPDDTPQVAARLVREDRRVEYRRHTTNRGHIATYNEGLEWASGDYVTLLSADDMLTAEALHRAVDLMEARPEVAFVHGAAVRRLLEIPSASPRLGEYSAHVISGSEFIASICETGLNPVTAPTVLVRTSCQKHAGGYLPELTHSGDLEMWLRLAVNGSVGYVSAPQGFYRQHAENMHIEYEASVKYLQQRRAAFDALFEGSGSRIHNAPSLHDGVRRCIAIEAFWQAARAFDRGDAPACRHGLSFAVDTHPSVCMTASWRRLRAKQVLGPRLWQKLRPLVDRMRGRDTVDYSETAKANGQ